MLVWNRAIKLQQQLWDRNDQYGLLKHKCDELQKELDLRGAASLLYQGEKVYIDSLKADIDNLKTEITGWKAKFIELTDKYLRMVEAKIFTDK